MNETSSEHVAPRHGPSPFVVRVQPNQIAARAIGSGAPGRTSARFDGPSGILSSVGVGAGVGLRVFNALALEQVLLRLPRHVMQSLPTEIKSGYVHVRTSSGRATAGDAVAVG